MKRLLTKFLPLIFIALVSCEDEKNEPQISAETPEITLNKGSLVLEIGKSEQLIAGFKPSDTPNKGHTWTSSNPAVAPVSNDGTVTGQAVGSATITATLLDGQKTASCAVTVVEKAIPVSSISLNVTSKRLMTGEKIQIIATISPSTATDKQITWSSSDEGVAWVDQNGLVTSVGHGNTQITAASNNGRKAVCNVEVVDKSIIFTEPEIIVVSSTSVLLKCTVTPVGYTVSEAGICYSKISTPTIADQCKKSTNTSKIGEKIIGLQPATQYYFRVYAKSDNEIFYSQTVIATTQGEIKTNFKVRTIRDESIEISTPHISGVKTLHICYGVAPNPEITDFTVTAKYDSDDDVYTAKLDDLNKGTTYYYRAFTQDGTQTTYYPTEGSAETIGKTVKLIRNGDDCSVTYTLPNGKTYLVKGCRLSKTNPAHYDSDRELYLSGGTGIFYYYSSDWLNTKTVTDLETGIVYYVPY